LIEAGQYLSALGLRALEAVSEKGAPLLAFALLDLPLLWQLLSLLPCSRFPALWLEKSTGGWRPVARGLAMAEEGGVLEANPIWISPYERHGARLVPRPVRFLFRRGNEGRCSLRRVGSRMASCWSAGATSESAVLF